MGSSETSQDREERKKKIVTVKAPQRTAGVSEAADKMKAPMTKPQGSFGESRALTAEERQYAGFDLSKESSKERSARLATEREKASSIRSRYGRESSAASRGVVDMAAASRTAGMAANREAISELEAREREAFSWQASVNLKNQINQLKQGGRPVQTVKPSGEILTVGVVRDGTFSGRQDFDPSTGRTKYDPLRGAYTTRAGTRTGGSVGNGGSGTEPSTQPATSSPMLPPAVTGDDSGGFQRRSMLSGGAAIRRQFTK
jgi:hypothetical protein